MIKVLVTGVAGFIGFHLASSLLKRGDYVVGVDNLNPYYDPRLKKGRLELLFSDLNAHRFEFIDVDISDRDAMALFFLEQRFDAVVNLAAQAGVRYSLNNPYEYVDSNLVGFVNILEGCRQTNVKHLVYASSSSVYGMNTKQPFSIGDRVDFPVSLYAATKKSNESMAFAYSHLYKIPTTGLRFFTVYGPWGRPDMAYYKFTEAILNGKPIDLYNNGVMKRDFTYIDDITQGVVRVIDKAPVTQGNPSTDAEAPHKLYNIGNNNPVALHCFVEALEEACGREAVKNFLPMQLGDVPVTFADVDDLIKDIGFKPNTSIREGLGSFVRWYHDYKLC